MAIRSNHYDAAFEAYLIATGRPYVAIDETRRAQLAGQSLKSMDFIVDGGTHRLPAWGASSHDLGVVADPDGVEGVSPTAKLPSLRMERVPARVGQFIREDERSSELVAEDLLPAQQ